MDSTALASTSSTRLDWIKITFIGSMHLAAATAFFFAPRLTDFILFFIFYLVSGFGITVGYHRLLTHRGFECSRFLRRFWALLGMAALQGGPVEWVGVHRRHHQASDRDGDPHSPRLSFFHGHIGWMLKKSKGFQPTVLARDLMEDKFLAVLNGGVAQLLPWLATIGICWLIGGWKGVVWGGVLRTVFVWHVTWSVNSVCHRWGSRPHQTRENSRNQWVVGLLALGEGWHNNHHYDPKAALHTEHWWQIDFSGYIIWTMEKLGVVRKVVRFNRRAVIAESQKEAA